MLKHLLVARYEAVVTHFSRLKVPKCLEIGPFWGQKWVKNGSEPRFPQPDSGPFGVHKRVILAHLGPDVSLFWPL